ncbi:MAG TPA: hypothetical protein VF981_16815 [Gemmatimonadaceae bacterium]
MRRTAHLLVIAGLILSAPACSARRGVVDESARTTLTVRNDHWLDHNIFLLRGTERVRMGTARGLATTRLTIPSEYVFGLTSLRFLADPVGSQATAFSENVLVAAGEEVQMIIRGPGQQTQPTGGP